MEFWKVGWIFYFQLWTQNGFLFYVQDVPRMETENNSKRIVFLTLRIDQEILE